MKAICRVTLVLMFVVLLFGLGGCTSSSSQTPPTAAPQAKAQIVLKISGSGTVVTILQSVQAAFEADTPTHRLDIVSGTGTDGGVKGVLESVLEAAAMGRAATTEEAGKGLQYVAFGEGTAGLFAHPGVTVKNLTKAQVQAVLAGEVKNWSEIGGANLPLVLYVRDEAESSTKILRKVVCGDAPFAATAKVLTSAGAMNSAVAGTPGSVGFGTWQGTRAAGAQVNGIAVDGVELSAATYPAKSPLGIGYLATRKADVQPLVDWLLSERGRTALHKVDVITAS